MPPSPPAARPSVIEKTVKIGAGDTLSGALQKAGLSRADAYKAVDAMAAHLDPKTIRPGQTIQIRFSEESRSSAVPFSFIRMTLDPLQTIVLEQGENGDFRSSVEKVKTVPRLYAKEATIAVSLFGSAEKAGIPNAVTAETIRIFSWDIDFQRDIRQGDSLEVLYEQLETEDGKFVKNGDLLYARLTVNGHEVPVYRFETPDGDVDYFTADGQSTRKALLKTPVDGARISSGFGAREHPVLGYTKMHKGLDFAAPTGTPIYAAGDGVIEMAGRWSSYGNYVRIRHNGSLKTAYAHLSRIDKSVKPGARVKQGQIIGAVGTTGRSTGPHLHYEVIVNGQQVNPQTHKSPGGSSLQGTQLAAFKKQVAQIDRQYASLSRGVKYAAHQDPTASGTPYRNE
ncbi:MAG: peptidoglycan DD-metalloendopeptidase family protein [Alphaproteobacteria bacterium]|nr:peptidoglycan DD-metalloendopeptidase family protein [Alphaproteobacteria bacterium]